MGIHIHDPQKPIGYQYVHGYTAYLTDNVSSGQTVSYIPAGTYYLSIDADWYVEWQIVVEN